MNPKEKPLYIGYCLTCGAIAMTVAADKDAHRGHLAAAIAQAIISGLEVERLEGQEAVQAIANFDEKRCHCQRPLFTCAYCGLPIFGEDESDEMVVGSNICLTTLHLDCAAAVRENARYLTENDFAPSSWGQHDRPESNEAEKDRERANRYYQIAAGQMELAL